MQQTQVNTGGGNNALYSVIKALCDERNITVNRMCSEIGVRPATMSDLKHGRSQTLSVLSLWKIAQYLDVAADVLVRAAAENPEKNSAASPQG